ncbi:MAG TPA: hypothetical protein VJT31_37090 [Rugosimonospora sp.]|nr:hypothetical protein [Rugosimonospora sp.]
MRLSAKLPGSLTARRTALACAAVAAVLSGTTVAYAGLHPATRVLVTPDRTVGFDGTVWASTYAGTTLYVGGDFHHAIVNGRLVPRTRLGAIDTRTGALLPWAPVANSIVRALSADSRWLYVAGAFTTVAGQPRAGLASVDLRTGAAGPLRHTLTGAAYALATGAGRLYLGGTFSKVDGRTVANLAAVNLATGALDTGFRATTDDRVSTLVASGGRLYVGGHFRRLDGAGNHARLGAVGLFDGRLDAGFRAYAPYWVDGVTLGPGAVYAGLAGPGGRAIRYRLDGTALWTSVTDGDVQAIGYLNGVVYAGGHFTVACPLTSRTPASWCPSALVARHKIAALDATTGRLTAWNPGTSGRAGVVTMSVAGAPDRLAIGGDFTVAGGVAHGHVAQWTNP